MSIHHIIQDRGYFVSAHEVRELVYYLYCNKQWTPVEIATECEKYEWKFTEGEVLKKKIIPVLITMAVTQPPKKMQEKEISLYDSEVFFLTREFLTPSERKLLYFLLVYSKFDNHPSGWIKYSGSLVDELIQVKDPKHRLRLMNHCCLKDCLELRVMGSKNPVTCYRVMFRQEEGVSVVRLHSMKEAQEFYNKQWGLE